MLSRFDRPPMISSFRTQLVTFLYTYRTRSRQIGWANTSLTHSLTPWLNQLLTRSLTHLIIFRHIRTLILLHPHLILRPLRHQPSRSRSRFGSLAFPKPLDLSTSLILNTCWHSGASTVHDLFFWLDCTFVNVTIYIQLYIFQIDVCKTNVTAIKCLIAIHTRQTHERKHKRNTCFSPLSEHMAPALWEISARSTRSAELTVNLMMEKSLDVRLWCGSMVTTNCLRCSQSRHPGITLVYLIWHPGITLVYLTYN